MSEHVGGQPQADGSTAVQSLDLRAANLTQELAQLLAQMGGKPTPSAAATGSQFNTLQALVSTATQTQQPHRSQSGTRDGLSSLSYTRSVQPVPPPPPAVALAPSEPSLVVASGAGYGVPVAGFPPPPSFGNVAPAAYMAPMAPLAPVGNGLLVSDPHDDEPMPIPSTWRQPTGGDDEKWYRQQLGAAGLGLLAGLVVVVPAVLWLSGFLGSGSQAKSVRHAAPDVPTVKVEVKPFKVASATADPRVAVVPPSAPAPASESADPTPPQSRSLEAPPVVVVTPPPVVAVVPPVPKPVEPPRSRAEELLAKAKSRIEANDIAGARDILQQAAETATSGAMTFLLAETYDPNMLASWQTRGVTANPEKARSLYLKARSLGESRAQQRLDWLMGN